MDNRITLGSFGIQKLKALCEGMKFPKVQTDSAVDMFKQVSASWFNSTTKFNTCMAC